MNSFLLAALLLLQGAVSAPGSGTVQGRILSADGTPAPGIRVTAMAQREPGQSEGVSVHASIAQTDSSGRYRLENVPSGRYYITAGLIDLPTYYPGVSALSGATVVAVADGSRVEGIDFSAVLPAGMKVSGRLTVLPTPRATPPTVALIGGTLGLLETPVNPDGTFEFLRVLPGSYTLQNFVGLPPLPVVVSDRDVTGLEVGRDAVGVRLSGRVVSPVTGPGILVAQTVTLSGASGDSISGTAGVSQSSGFSVRPDVNGNFEALRVPPGSYGLRALPSIGPTRPVTVVVADKDITGVEIRVPFTAEISGRVVLESGALVNLPTNTMIQASGSNSTSGTSVQGDGTFRLRLAEGDYQLGLRGLPLGYTVKSISLGDAILTAPLKVAPGNVPANVVITMASVPLDSIQGVKVSGRITGVPGASLTGARILLRGNDAFANNIEIGANADGTFEFPKVPPGTYIASVSGIPNGSTSPLATRITVGTDNMSGIQIPVDVRTTVSGRTTVVNTSGAVVPGLTGGASLNISFRRGNGSSSTIVRPDGTFSLPLTEGEHTIGFPNLSAGYEVKSIMSGSLDLLKNPLKIENGIAPPPIEVQIEAKP